MTVAGRRIPVGLREIRLGSGLALALFLTTHFANHALGLVSLDAMEAGRLWFERLWSNPVGLIVLYGSVGVHFALALRALHGRRTLRLPLREAAQYALGFGLPLLLVPHVVGTRVAESLLDRWVDYPLQLNALWIASPVGGARQVCALAIAWLHGCLGIWFWRRGRAGFARWSGVLLVVAVLVPVLAILGFAAGGKELADRPDLLAKIVRDPAGDARLAAVSAALYAAILSAIVGALLLRGAKFWLGRHQRVRVTYPNGQVVAAPAGSTVLEASRSARLPHLSVCGGRGRCSTCRVRVTRGFDALPAPNEAERSTLTRIAAEPDIRLACQLRPVQDLAVAPILSLAGERKLGRLRPDRESASRERDIAVLFCDLRGFTSIVERRLPFDSVFILNTYFGIVGEAVDDSGGYLDKFIGDGALALFGLDSTPEEGARRALRAAASIAAGIADLNRRFHDEWRETLRVAIGLHFGPAIVGSMGYGEASGLTAIGDTINVASRLEGVAKKFDAELVVSADLTIAAGIELVGCERRTVPIRGRVAPVTAWILPRADVLRRVMDGVKAA